jgi:hypothetical protein
MDRLRVRTFVVLAVLFGSTATALLVPTEDGGRLPATLLLLFLTGRQLRRRTSPESRRA